MQEIVRLFCGMDAEAVVSKQALRDGPAPGIDRNFKKA